MARRLKYSRGSSPQEFQDLLPGRRNTDIGIATVVAPAVDNETPVIEAADVDTVTIRVDGGRANVDAFEEPGTTDLKVGRDEPAHLGGIRNVFERREKLALLFPVFAGRVRNRRLPDGEPSERRLVLAGELLIGVPAPGLAVAEVTGLEFTNIEQGHRGQRCGHHGVTVILAPLENVLRRQTFGECRDLFVGVDDARASLADFLRRDEIRAEDGLRQRVVGRLGREATNPSEQVRGKAGVLVEDLCAVFVESRLVVLRAERFGGSLSFRTVCRHQSRRVQCCFHRHHLLYV